MTGARRVLGAHPETRNKRTFFTKRYIPPISTTNFSHKNAGNAIAPRKPFC